MERVAVVIPTYNEAAVIERTMRALQQVCGSITDFEMQILVLDSHSTDGTAAIVQRLSTSMTNLTLITEPAKSGLGSAYFQAFNYAINQLNADIVFEYDADGSHQPHYLAEMLDYFRKQDVDVVNASRFIRGGKIPDDWSLKQRFLSVIGNIVARVLLTNKIKDHTSGFRACRTRILKQINFSKFLSKRYAYKIQLLFSAKLLGAKIVEHPIVFLNRQQGQSKAPSNNAIDSLRVVLLLSIKRLERFSKMCFVGLIGLVVQLIIYNIARHFIHPVYATAISVECATINNFLLNNQLVFHAEKLTRQHAFKRWVNKFLLFNFLALGSILTQMAAIAGMIMLLGRGVLIENLTLIAAIGLFTVVKYHLYARLVWQRCHIETDKNVSV